MSCHDELECDTHTAVWHSSGTQARWVLIRARVTALMALGPRAAVDFESFDAPTNHSLAQFLRFSVHVVRQVYRAHPTIECAFSK